jgi:hypothetical protein
MKGRSVEGIMQKFRSYSRCFCVFNQLKAPITIFCLLLRKCLGTEIHRIGFLAPDPEEKLLQLEEKVLIVAVMD